MTGRDPAVSPGPGLLDLGALARAIARPEPFAPHDAPFWEDPHIAACMLAAHLDPNTDAASAPPDVVERRVAHLAVALRLGRGGRLLDLGCGPGLYAAAGGLAIDYRVGDYTRDPLGGPFDAAVLVYLDFGVLDDRGRDALLDGVRGAVRRGGRFALDVHAPTRPRPPDATVAAHASEGGFWRPGPHLVV